MAEKARNPSRPDEVSVQAECRCGTKWDVPEREWPSVSGSHLQARGKSREAGREPG